KYLMINDIECFDFSHHYDLKIVGCGGSSVVYSAIFQGKKYALKSLNNNLRFGDKLFNQLIKEHSKNILIDNGKALISDFGISKSLDDTSDSSSVLMGVPAYIDPRCLQNKIKRDKKSDIYSLGVLFWELTSGIPPFHSSGKISHEESKKPIANTPSDYVKLYKDCRSSNLDQRPTLDEILLRLKNLSKTTTIEFISNDISIQSNFLESNNSESSLLKTTKEISDYANIDELNDHALSISLPIENGHTLSISLPVGNDHTLISVPVRTIDELWNFFVVYFLNTGLLWVFQPHTRDIVVFERSNWIGAFQIFVS
ncbi:16668_t:CDS:2, partial [Cetraspora pellucida]